MNGSVTDLLRDYERELAHARDEVRRADDDVREATDRRSTAEQRVEALSRIVSGFQILASATVEPQRERLPDLPISGVAAVTDEDRPRGQEAVRRIMQESPRAWRQIEIIQEVQRRGWIDVSARQPAAAVRVATRRLMEAGVIEKIGPGLFRFKLSDDASSELAARAADGLETPSEGEE
jgi:hypothetical protein